jgi:hypothetical protein
MPMASFNPDLTSAGHYVTVLCIETNSASVLLNNSSDIDGC